MLVQLFLFEVVPLLNLAALHLKLFLLKLCDFLKVLLLRLECFLLPVLCGPEALALLQGHTWPGNVRELRNLMARLAVRLAEGTREIGVNLLASMLPARTVPSDRAGKGVFIPKGTTLADAEWFLIDAALKDAGYNRSKAAELLGIGERTLRRKLNKP